MAEVNRMIVIVNCSSCSKQIGVLLEIPPEMLALLEAALPYRRSISLSAPCPDCGRTISANAPVGWISAETLSRFLESDDSG